MSCHVVSCDVRLQMHGRRDSPSALDRALLCRPSRPPDSPNKQELLEQEAEAEREVVRTTAEDEQRRPAAHLHLVRVSGCGVRGNIMRVWVCNEITPASYGARDQQRIYIILITCGIVSHFRCLVILTLPNQWRCSIGTHIIACL